MIEIKLTFPPPWPLKRQTPNHSAVWDNCRFFINQPIKKCDYWVVFEGLTKTEKTICPKENIILITGEPPTLKQYRQHYINQFHTVITCHQDMRHPHVIHQQQGFPWHIGRKQQNHVNLSWSKDYDELVAMSTFPKVKQMSVISSIKDFSEGHRQRLEFVKILKNHFGDSIDVFGRGLQEIEDKWDALAPYKYHIALENAYLDDWWTEKLADPFLAGCYPIYYGCPNIEKYFDQAALTQIDITQPEQAIQIIESCLNESKYEHAQKKIEEARLLVLNRYNLFPMLCEYVNNNEINLRDVQYGTVIIIKESSRYLFMKSLFRRLFSH
ncbi:MAG: hypothetical protein JXC33_12365 [Deltaproteobacteria bacterium]|nr:hypothetical protein [Deltaproteobacteria bacterium]